MQDQGEAKEVKDDQQKANPGPHRAICKTCGATPPNHVPSLLDREGIGHPGHRIDGGKVEAKEAKFHELPESEQGELLDKAGRAAYKEQADLLEAKEAKRKQDFTELLKLDFQAMCPDCGGVGEDDNANFWCHRCKAHGWVRLADELERHNRMKGGQDE